VSGTEIPDFLPIWSCSVWGLPCPLHYCRGGALLPHLFTLTLALPPGRYVFCGTFRQPGLNPASRTLSGTLLCGVRTFLSPRPKTPRATVRSGCLRNDYTRLPASGFGNSGIAFAVSSGVRLVNLTLTGATALLRKPDARAGSPPHAHRRSRSRGTAVPLGE
jgi:hypothetical protein